MSGKNSKQFGVWMDSQNATIVGREQLDTGNFTIIGYEKNEGVNSNSTESAANHSEKTVQHKFFKQITAHMQNVDEVHVTGPGTAQEQFIHYLADTPQYKNTIAKESTSIKMDNEKLIEFISNQFN